jgi:hypothetical protein
MNSNTLTSKLTTSDSKRCVLDDLCSQLMTLPVRTVSERDVLFRRLCQDMERLPRPFVEHRLLPVVLSFSGAGSSPSGGGGLTPDLAKLLLACKAEPALQALASSPEPAVRSMLLEALALKHLSMTKIVPNGQRREKLLCALLVGGLQDPQPAVRDGALRASLAVGADLSERLTAECLRAYVRIVRRDDIAALRANALLCLGRCPIKSVESALGAKGRRAELVDALVANLAPPPGCPARNVHLALTCLQAFRSIFSTEDVFCRLLPAISPLVIVCMGSGGDPKDTIACIPDQAASLLRHFVMDANVPVEDSVVKDTKAEEENIVGGLANDLSDRLSRSSIVSKAEPTLSFKRESDRAGMSIVECSSSTINNTTNGTSNDTTSSSNTTGSSGIVPSLTVTTSDTTNASEASTRRGLKLGQARRLA